MNLENIYNVLNILVAMITILVYFMKLIYNAFIEYKKYKGKKIFELYCKRESDNFYLWIMLSEIGACVAAVFIVFVGLVIMRVIAHFLKRQILINERLETVVIGIMSIYISFFLLKMKWVRKRLLGDKEGRILIFSSILSFNIGITCEVWGGVPKDFGIVFMSLYFVCEILGFLHFQGRYIKYDFSSMKLYLSDGDSITCENIEKVRRKKKYVIVEKENQNIVLQYDKIWKVNYYGLPKIVLIEENEKYTIPRMLRFSGKVKDRLIYYLKQKIRGFLKAKKQK